MPVPDKGYVKGYAGEKITLRSNGKPVMGLKELSWEATQDLEFLKQCMAEDEDGDITIDIIASNRAYSVSFTVNTLNKALFSEPVYAERSNDEELESFEFDGETYTNILDLPKMDILIQYPIKNGVRRKRRVIGFKFGKASGKYGLDEKILNEQFEGKAVNIKGFV